MAIEIPVLPGDEEKIILTYDNDDPRRLIGTYFQGMQLPGVKRVEIHSNFCGDRTVVVELHSNAFELREAPKAAP